MKTIYAALLALLLAPAAFAQQPRWTATGTITTAASVIAVPSHDFALAAISTHGTYAGISVVFEFSDDSGVTWYQDQCARSDSPVMEIGETLIANAVITWDCPVAASTNFRVRSTAYTSGTATINITLTQDGIDPSVTTSSSGIYNSTAPTVTSGNALVMQQSANGDLYVATRTNALQVSSASALAANALTPFIASALGSTTNVIASGTHNLYDFCLLNNNAAVVFVEFFNVVQGSVTLGTTVPADAYVIPASGTLCFSSDLPKVAVGAAGFSMAAVTAYNGATPGSVTGSVHYK